MKHTPLALLALLAPLAPSASADLITWSAPQDATAATDVSLNGTLVTARNCWASTLAAPTVNGVAFSAFAPLGWGNGGWTLLNGSTSGDADYDALLDSARVTSYGSAGNPTDWGAIQIDSLGSLTMGDTYEIQVWYCDQRPGNGSNFLNDRQMLLSSATGAGVLSGGVITNLGSVTQGTISAAIEADPNNLSGAGDTVFGQFITGTFTRTSTDPLYLLVQGVHPIATVNLRPHVTAFQIRQIDSTVGTNFCDPADVNSTGFPVSIAGSFGTGVGSDLHLEATGGPALEFGYFLVGTASLDPGIALPQGGHLCLDTAGSLGRYNISGAGNSIGQFDGAGVLQNLVGNSTVGSGFDVPATVPIAGSPAILTGSTWYFQLWYRDTPAGPGSANLSNGLAVTFP
ncbi:MAG: hypothetical protein R3F17_12720 [Planctomycetota bacterium]